MIYNYEIDEPKYYVHVLPNQEGYLNVSSIDGVFLDNELERGGFKTEFTKSEIEKMKCDERFKGINFDECLEEVQEDEY